MQLIFFENSVIGILALFIKNSHNLELREIDLLLHDSLFMYALKKLLLIICIR